MLQLLIFCSSKGPYFDDKLAEGCASLFILVLTQLLLLKNFFQLDKVVHRDITLIKAYILIFLSLFSHAIAREVGMGMNFIKFHLLLHLYLDLLQFGPATSWESSSRETGHKVFKANAQCTQKSLGTFEEQVAKQHVNCLAIECGSREIAPHVSSASTSPSPNIVSRGANYFVTKEGMFDTKLTSKSKTVTHKASKWQVPALMEQVTVYIQENVLPKVSQNSITLKMQARINGLLYYGNPGYSNTSDVAELGHHDWVYVKWDGHGTIASRIVVFMEITDLLEPLLDDETNGKFKTPGLYALVQAFAQDLDYSPDNSPDDNFLSHQSCPLIAQDQLVHDDIMNGA